MTVTVGMKWILLSWFAMAPAVVQLNAQGISPVMQEFQKKARGVVVVNNLSEMPKTVSCRPQSFSVDEHGKLQLQPLDPKLHVRVASERVVIAPKSSRQVSFDATPATVPAWFVVSCKFMPMEPGPGLTVALELSSIVLVRGGPFNIDKVTLSANRVANKVEITVENNGPEMTRVESVELRGHGKQVSLGTFLLFPHQKRLAEAEWKESATPETARIQIGKQHLEAPVH